MEELWQLYDNQGRPIPGKGLSKNEVFSKGLFHGASHIWIWRRKAASIEVLLQKRANDKRTWPGLYDISAAGHINLGESPIEAAVREAKEEIGHTLDISKLQSIGAHRCFAVAKDKTWTENEISFLYLLEVDLSGTFKPEDDEVDSLEWKTLPTIKRELADKTLRDRYVPRGKPYFSLIFEALEGCKQRLATTL